MNASSTKPRYYGEAGTSRFVIDGDRVFLGNKATGKGDVITLKRLTQFGDSIRLYKNRGDFGGLWGEGPLLRDYITERRAAVKATA